MRLPDGEICGTVAADVIGPECSAPNPGISIRFGSAARCCSGRVSMALPSRMHQYGAEYTQYHCIGDQSIHVRISRIWSGISRRQFLHDPCFPLRAGFRAVDVYPRTYHSTRIPRGRCAIQYALPNYAQHYLCLHSVNLVHTGRFRP